MVRLGRVILWGLIFVLVLLAIDLSLIYLGSDISFASAPRRFYVDFRTRLLLLVFPEEDVVAAKIAVREEPVSGRKASLANDGEPRYFYIDGEGEIRFAVTLRDIPSAFRSEAKSLAR
ncbi:MAG: hypothetical protein GXY54_09710 [Deltaproteobacteria bacterium]|nr:hypothetical protein [Deltaproteobacteria bacterium]